MSNTWRDMWDALRDTVGGSNPSGDSAPARTGDRGKGGSPPLNCPATTLGRLLDQTADRFGDAPAIDFAGERWTWSQVRATADRLAGGLAVMGVRSGDRVLVSLPNCPDFLFVFFAAQKLGAVVVNAGPLTGRDDLAELIRMTGPRLVVGLDLQAEKLTSAAGSEDACWLWVSLEGYQRVLERIGYRFKLWQGRGHRPGTTCQATVEDLLAHAPPRPPTVAPDPGSVAVLQPTGGTTGTLKVAELTHRNLLANVTQIVTWSRQRAGQERMLAVLPFFHVYGLIVLMLAPTFTAGCIIPMTRPRCDELLDLIERHRPTVLSLVPVLVDQVCDALASDPRPGVVEALSDCLVISGAAALPERAAARFESITGLKIVQGYGLTEASPVTHVNDLLAPRPGAIGRPLPDTLARVVDLDDPAREARPGEPGELLVSGPQVMRGYFRAPDATAGAIVADADGRRWLRTADVVRVDEDGVFHIVDRAKDMINRGGLKVWPGKVEAALLRHASVAEAAVFGAPDPTHGEQVVAAVVCNEPADQPERLRDELRSLCREHLAPYEVPRRIEFFDELPRSAIGKVLKHELRARDEQAGEAARPPAGDRPLTAEKETA